MKHEIDVSGGIEVGGFHWTVISDEREQRRMECDNNNGIADCQYHEISVRIKIEPALQSKTLLHEFIEAVNFVYCVNKMEHDMIQRMSFGLHQVMESLGVRFVVREKKAGG